MFKRIKEKVKENETLQRIKEFWKNPKTHDIAVLIFWLIFIVVVIVFARGITPSSNTKITESKPEVASFENTKNYDFTYQTNDLEISGQTYNDASLFYVNNHRYYYKNNVYLIKETATLEPNYDLSVLKINTIFLNNLVSGITPTEEMNFKQYIVPLDRFINLYDIDTDVDLSKAINYNITISTYLKDNQISKVIIDLSNYYTLKTGTITTYPLTIYYYNINNVSDFTKEYDKLVEVKK